MGRTNRPHLKIVYVNFLGVLNPVQLYMEPLLGKVQVNMKIGHAVCIKEPL